MAYREWQTAFVQKTHPESKRYKVILESKSSVDLVFECALDCLDVLTYVIGEPPAEKSAQERKPRAVDNEDILADASTPTGGKE